MSKDQLLEQIEFLKQAAELTGDARLKAALSMIQMMPAGSPQQAGLVAEVYRQVKEAMNGYSQASAPELEWEPTILPQAPEGDDQYDVIIIGSGMGGLTAGVELASAGAKVLVLEAHYSFGGAAHNYMRKGKYIFDAGVETVSGLGHLGSVNHFLKRHDLWKEIELLKTSFHFRLGTRYVKIPNTLEAWIDDLCTRYPSDAEGVREFFKIAINAYEEKYSFFAPDRITPRPPTDEEKMSYQQIHPNNYRLMTTTWGEFMGEYLKDPGLRKEVSLLSHFIGDRNEDTPTSDMLPLLGYFIVGGYRIKGGSAKLANALVGKLREYGSTARHSVTVNKIIIEDGVAKGVQTEKGTFYAPVVISNVDPRLTYENLVGLEHLSEEYQAKVATLEPSMSAFIFQGIFSKPFPTDAIVTYYLDEPVEAPEIGLTIGRCAYVSAGAHDPDTLPAGEGQLTINLNYPANADKYANMSKEEYAELKEKLSGTFMKLLDKIDPELKDSLIWHEISSPKTARQYLRTYQGSIYNIRFDKDRKFPNTNAPIQGLYLCGAGVHGPGVEAVVISGGYASEKIKPHFEARRAAAVQ
ncbi:phytoene desaturase family protein [Tumebacillus flagellatus]|uniref:Amine oxidase domain-containing protein n=1 Tax=Tumebacillus flagellatus TaxID=1157490 RepID=A0A074LWL6_9BACL|nr:NAD(P)/FAD-dependent oxidoreductase [Tumebacillus flagellatus]KEO85010.1 hypothetical protein EL26_00135 [Tumebacillus flagellatus]